MGSRLSGLGTALYDSEKKQFLGRDGAGWGKLGVFYFFFYLGLAGFFCAMLAVFMALSPRDHPRYYSEASRMSTRSNPLSPGLGFRPQPEVDKNLITFEKDGSQNENAFVKSLDNYLTVFYPPKAAQEEDGGLNDDEEKSIRSRYFTVKNPGDCVREKQYGFSSGQPCVLVKMNKIVDFVPQPGGVSYDDKKSGDFNCQERSDAVAIRCYGEYAADVDNVGKIVYISENGVDDKCGSLNVTRFPYMGKYNRHDLYQAPYIWVQFKEPKPNVLINVLCRVYGQNIDFDRKTGRALTRFQLYVKDLAKSASSKSAGEH